MMCKICKRDGFKNEHGLQIHMAKEHGHQKSPDQRHQHNHHMGPPRDSRNHHRGPPRDSGEHHRGPPRDSREHPRHNVSLLSL